MKRLCIALFLVASTLVGQNKLIPKSPFVVNADYNRFRYDAQSGYLEISVAVYPGLMTLLPIPSGYKGAADIKIVIRNTHTDSLAAYDRVMMDVSIPDTTMLYRKTPFMTKSGYALPKGSYQLSIMAVDSLFESRRDSISFKFEIAEPSQQLSISDLELCTNVSASDDKNDQFYKNSFRVLTNPSIVFGSATSPALFFYTELYNLDPKMTYQVRYQIIDGQGTVVKDRQRVRAFGTKSAVDVGALGVTDLPSAKYKMHYLISDTLGNQFSQSDKLFYVFNADVQQKTAVTATTRVAEFAGLGDEELNEEMQRMKYLLRTDDMGLYAKVSTTDGRREYVAKLWVELESGARGWDINRLTYLQRIAQANDKFRALGRDGWKTDRGRVFMLFGTPDEVEHFPSTGSNKPYEVWHYRSIENSVYFVFIDVRSNGLFELVHSTKRGELQNEQWQTYLR